MDKELARLEALETKRRESTAQKIGITIGEKMPATTPMETTLQKGILEDLQILGGVNAASGRAQDEFFTYAGRAKGFAAEKMEKFFGDAPGPWKTHLEKQQAWKNETEQLFQVYRKKVTGAQAAIKEIENLRQIMLNKEMSKSQFLGSVNQIREKVSRSLRLQRKLLREGFDLGNPADVKRMQERGDTLWSTDSQFNDAGERIHRLRTLKTQGLNPQQAAFVLKNEGYFTEEQAQQFGGMGQ
jgi:hypothetical protein